MSNLIKPYEISVWDDIWDADNHKFIEQRLGVIGSSEMQSQNRVVEPELTRNTNGTKKFTFKLYKQYVDNITGEKVSNPFYDWLTNERKVKLKYNDTWHDFVVKNIEESSSKYLYTYQLEDAHIQELSKNGFGFVFDEELDNNMGTIKELGTKLLDGTDWDVESENAIERIEETLVYVSIPTSKTIQHITEIDGEVTPTPAEISADIPGGKTFTALAAYSSCTTKPHRFQFFYVGGMVEGDKLTNAITRDDNRYVTNKDCQYYIEVDGEENNKYEQQGNFLLPTGITTTTIVEEPLIDTNGVTISSYLRGKRYGFSQRQDYVPTFGRYMNVYEDEDKNKYYGYEHTEYKSPVLIQNIISGSQLKSTSGWIGTAAAQGDKATVEAVYGRKNGNSVINFLTDISNGNYTQQIENYQPYLKLTLSERNFVLNSGPYDNRISIDNMNIGDEYKIECIYFSEKGTNTGLTFSLGEYVYSAGRYTKKNGKITFSGFEDGVTKVVSSEYTPKDFKKNSQVRLCIQGNGTYYISKISLYKVTRDEEGNIITPEIPQNSSVLGTIERPYYYYNEKDVKDAIDSESVKPVAISKNLDYTTYKPVYNDNSEKIRAISTKESNYFNILQELAETFEMWLSLDVEHDNDGKIISKKVTFKNYIGKNNYAGFKYGVNLKDIKRTFESKKLTTKLIVRQNSNELAPSGFCTIARAKNNPTGENYIYDFQYFFNTGMMNARDYLETVYVLDGAEGKDIDKTHTEINLNGYFPRIRAINDKIEKETELLINASKDLTSLKAQLEVARVGLEAAKQGRQKCEEDIRFLTGIDITNGTALSEEISKRTDVKNILSEYGVYLAEEKKYSADYETLEKATAATEEKYEAYNSNIDEYSGWKDTLYKLLYSTYSRFIQEGTWLSEDYYDDDKYYTDALSVMYNSCYPQVAYNINVIEISRLPGYEGYNYDLGDTTYVQDPEFFDGDFRVEVVVTETADNLDDPSKNKIKVQNFKNQFQDLFQKITSTVQQTQYSTGSYEKAVALAEANQERKQQFLTDALDGMGAKLAVAGQQTVMIDENGITITDDDSPSDSIRLIGGAILLSKQDENGQKKWTTGVTSDGLSANLITAGVINAGQITIMNSDQPAFRWDTYGISAFDTTTYEGTTSGFNYDKFVRFDKNGIYGIDGTVNGLNWHPQDGKELDDINEKATFALTWEGLKVTGDGAIAWIGKHNYDTGLHDGDGNSVIASGMIRITNNEGKETFCVANDGNVAVRGNLFIGDSTVESLIESKISSTTDTNDFSWTFSTTYGMYMYAGKQNPNNVVFKVYNDNGTKKLYIKGDGEFTGKITANGGKIAGFDIIKTDESKQYICSNRKSSYSDNTDGIYLGQDGIGLGKGTFYVKSNGEMYCGNGNITGGSIKIGGSETKPNFYVDGSGNVKMVGGIVLGSSITWESGPPAELKGDQGIPGKKGEDGKTSYLHIAYATSADGKTGFSTTVSAGKTYIGQYTDHIADDSTDPSKYKWTLIKGDKGDKGAPGSNAYVTREVLLGLEYKDEDGLYPFTIGDKTYMGLNATAIRTGYLGFKDLSGNSTNYYIDPFNAIEDNQFYINLPNFCIAKDEWKSNSYIALDTARLGAVEFETFTATDYAPQARFMSHYGLILPAWNNVTEASSGRIVWSSDIADLSNFSSKFKFCLIGHKNTLELRNLNGTDNDFKIFGTSWKDVLSRLATVESKLGISSGGGSGSNTGGSTDTHEHTYENNVCTVCSKTKCEIEGKHNYFDGSCTRCGATDPNYGSGCSHDLANPEGWTVAPTCISEGEEVWYCPECQEEWHQVVPRDPDLHAGDKGEPTWADGGYQGGTWSCCGAEWYEFIS